MIPESQISECPEHEVKSKTGNIFVNEKILEEHSVKFFWIDPYFYEQYKKIQTDKNGCQYILYRIDVYFTEYLLAVEVDEKDHIDRDFIFEKKRQEALEKNLVVNLLGLIQEGYDADYETSRIQINMNTINKFMSEMHLKQPGFTDSACGPFTKNKERIEKFMQTGNTDFIYKNELDKACFQHDMAYGKSKDLAKRTQTKFKEIKHLKLRLIQNMMSIKKD